MTTFSDPLTRVVFFQVNDSNSKLQRICETAQSHFHKKEPILFLVDDDRSSAFVDELLWKFSFLPHTASDISTKDFIAISKTKKNVNGAKIAFNLCPTPLFIDASFKIIYEFEDLSALTKKNLSSLRFDAYKQAGYLIEAR